MRARRARGETGSGGGGLRGANPWGEKTVRGGGIFQRVWGAGMKKGAAFGRALEGKELIRCL